MVDHFGLFLFSLDVPGRHFLTHHLQSLIPIQLLRTVTILSIIILKQSLMRVVIIIFAVRLHLMLPIPILSHLIPIPLKPSLLAPLPVIKLVSLLLLIRQHMHVKRLYIPVLEMLVLFLGPVLQLQILRPRTALFLGLLDCLVPPLSLEFFYLIVEFLFVLVVVAVVILHEIVAIVLHLEELVHCFFGGVDAVFPRVERAEETYDS